HPFAQAVRDALIAKTATLASQPFGPAGARALGAVHAGQGVSRTLDSRQILFGHERWLAEMGADLRALREQVDSLEAAGHSVSWLAERRDGGAPIVLAALAFS